MDATGVRGEEVGKGGVAQAAAVMVQVTAANVVGFPLVRQEDATKAIEMAVAIEMVEEAMAVMS